MTTTIDFDIDIECAECGRRLSAKQDRVGDLVVEPCDDCLEGYYDNGYDEGLLDGVKNGA